ncbi:Cu+-exporting ATPase [Inquilinus ginsengisoli]|uniref:Cu+-exporting ATPase n=1 Tax=Inquilinus ginsengisoli TaxID=363840 RepID=A0ABU1JXU3_9PROT|nr:heavy metal translocating P-type ATPase [Inquilinus ginsengisoli]MDR6293440.1 Cu+-exporting ATPase [Inquilinus ginsengisoli]
MSTTASVRLDITGMTCAACAGRVERALSRTPGVLKASVNLALERADIALAPDGPDRMALAEAVRDAGYDVRPMVTAEEAEGRPWIETATLAAAVLLTLPLVLNMAAMALGLAWHLTPWTELALATPVQFWAGARFYRGAWASLRHRSPGMDVLVALGTSAAWGFSAVQVALHGDMAMGQLYFEASAVVITLVLLGKRLEARAKRGASAALRALMALRPETARVLTADGPVERPVDELRPGDRILVRPGERFPVDATVEAGDSEADESLVTGESLPVAKRPGDTVAAGALNGTGALTLAATAVGEDSTIARIVRLVEAAQSGKAPIQKLVDRVSAVFVPIVLVLAVATFAGWLLAGGSIDQALGAAVAVLVIACPCAMGLATPAAIVTGTGAAARAGILIRDIETIERAPRIDTVVFDKTGTLTEGRPAVTDIVAPAGDEESLLALAAAVQAGSEHPLARAVEAEAMRQGVTIPAATGITARPGRGVSGTVGGRSVIIGNAALMQESGAALPEALAQALAEREAAGRTVMLVAIAGEVRGAIAVADPVRAGAAEAVARLTDLGIATRMLSGDARAVADSVAARIGITEVEAPVRPEDKVATIARLHRGGARVAMVGDGINDAPALAEADLGIAMGGGTDVAMAAAAITLMRPDPRLVADALAISRATWNKVRQNLFWAFAYNVVGLPLAALGLLNPALAGAAMALSSISVVANALLLRRWRPRA